MPDERRRFFRLNHPLKLRLYPQPAAEQPPPNPLDAAIQEQLNQLRQHQPELAELLSLLNQKINQQNPAAASSPLWPLDTANLSACGLAFEHTSAAATGSLFALELHLDDTSEPITLQGRLLDCQAHPSHYYWRLNFEGISSATQDTLIQHLLKRQRQERTPPQPPL